MRKSNSQMFGKVLSKGTVIALVIGAAMAQNVSAFDFAWGAWGRAVWAPLVIQGGAAYDDDTGAEKVKADGERETATYIWTGSGPGWNGPLAAAIGFNLSGTDPNGFIGFSAALRFNADGENNWWFAPDNNANVWVKPLSSDVLTIRAGLFQVDDLRGKLGGVNENFLFGKSGDEDAIFARIDSAGRFGAHFKIAPIESLQIHAAFGANAGIGETIDTHYGKDSADAIGDVLSTAQYGIGYTISDIGLARVQFIGGTYGKGTLADGAYPAQVKNYNQIQLAFQLTAVENLDLDFGAQIPFKMTGDASHAVYKTKIDISGSGTPTEVEFKSGDDSYQAPIAIRLAAKYTAGDLGIFFGLRTAFAGKLEGKINIGGVADVTLDEGFFLGADIEPSYKLGDAGSIVGNISFALKGNDKANAEWSGGSHEEDLKNGTTDMGLGVSFHKPIGGGNFSIGLAANLPLGGDGYSEKGKEVAKARALKVAVPMTITYSF